MKGVFVILDGVADEPCYVLGQKTPLESAKTPNLDFFAEHGKIDSCQTVKQDFVPGSEHGILGLLGYDPFEYNRGAFEAAGMGLDVKNGDLVFRCNFATSDGMDSRNVLDRRAGRTLTNAESFILAKAVNEQVKLPYKFHFFPSVQHRGVLIIKGGFSDNITDVEAKNGKISFSQPLEDMDDSKLSADILNQFVRKSFEVLDKHPINIARAKKGLFSANLILCRGGESDKVRLKKIKGKWMALGYMPLQIGIANLVGMNVYKFRHPPLKSMDVYENIYRSLNLAIKYSIKMLKRYRKKYDYFYIHLKETDIPGHDNKPMDKVKMIELIDKKFFGFLRNYLAKEGRLIVTADHVTACRKKAHTEGLVPLLSYSF